MPGPGELSRQPCTRTVVDGIMGIALKSMQIWQVAEKVPKIFRQIIFLLKILKQEPKLTIHRYGIFLVVSLFTAFSGFSSLPGSLALATEQMESAEGRWVSINGQGVIDAPLSTVIDHFKDVNKADSMVPGLKTKKILTQVSDSERIDFDHFEVPWPFADRYTIYRARAKNIAGREILITLDSLENYPFEDNGKVPARIKESSFLLQSLPEDDSKTRVTIKLTVDPGGHLPVWLINLVSGSWSKKFFKNLRKNIKKEMGQKIFLRHTGPEA